MKPTTCLTALLLGLGLAAALPAQDVKVNLPGTATPPAAPAAPQYTDEQMLETYGWVLGKKTGLHELNFTPAQIAAIQRGMNIAAAGQESPYDMQKIGPSVQAFLEGKSSAYEARQQVEMTKLKQQALTENVAFFTKVKADKNVIALADGLCYEIIQPGAGAYPRADQVVRVNYTGKLINGTVFDSSAAHGGEPVEFKLNGVIPGWTEGIQKINKGGKIRLYIPPDLAYGDRPPPSIPPSATLVFDVELLDFKDAPAATAIPAAPAGN